MCFYCSTTRRGRREGKGGPGWCYGSEGVHGAWVTIGGLRDGLSSFRYSRCLVGNSPRKKIKTASADVVRSSFSGLDLTCLVRLPVRDTSPKQGAPHVNLHCATVAPHALTYERGNHSFVGGEQACKQDSCNTCVNDFDNNLIVRCGFSLVGSIGLEGNDATTKRTRGRSVQSLLVSILED